MSEAMERQRILTPVLVAFFVACCGAMSSFFLLLSVVPLYATTSGADGLGAGLTTAALMVTTVAGEPLVPRLVARFGYRAVYAAGLVLLGVPALALAVSSSYLTIVAVCLVRGLGFAIAVVVSSAVVAELVPPSRRGEGLGLYGVVVGVPSVLALPLGLWLATHAGYSTVFVLGAVVSLAGLVVVGRLPGRRPRSSESLGMLRGLADPALRRPAIVFAVTTMASGTVVTFLPLAVPGQSSTLVAFALFVQAAVTTASRWWAGRHGDRRGAVRLMVPGVAVAAAGLALLVAIPHPFAILASMVLFGLGFGVMQNASLAVMFARAPASAYGTVSAMWNFAYDVGLGIGAVGFGALAGSVGYPASFGIMAALILVSLPLAVRDRRVSPQ